MVTFGVLIMYTFTVKRRVHFLVFMDNNDTLIRAVSANILCRSLFVIINSTLKD